MADGPRPWSTWWDELTDRELPLDKETRKGLDDAKTLLGFPPILGIERRSGFFRSRYYSYVAQVFLAGAQRAGAHPDPNYQPPRENGHPAYPLHLDTGGLFDELQPPDVASILKPAVLRYVRATGSPQWKWGGRLQEGASLPESLIFEIHLSAVQHARTAEEELSSVVNAELPSVLEEMPDPEDRRRNVYFRPEPAAYKMCRTRALDTEQDLDWMLARHIKRRLAVNGGSRPEARP